MKDKKENKRLIIAVIVAFILLLIDQITKTIVTCSNIDITILKDVLNIRLVFNSGIAFGIGQDNSIITFIVSNLIVLGIIMRFIWLQKDRMTLITLYGLFMILSRWNSEILLIEFLEDR